MAARCDISKHKTPKIINRNSSKSVETTHLQTGVYSTHTRFLDDDDSPTENEAHQPRVQITRCPVEAPNRFGHLNEMSKFNNLWTKKAWTSELLALQDRQEIESILISQIHSTEKTRKTRFRFNSLPVEIREMIYEYTLLRPLEKKKKSASKTPVFLRALKIYGAKHLYIEAKNTFHSINQFTYNIVKTLKFADPEVCGMFRKLVLIIPCTFTPLSPIPSQTSLLYYSLRHLTLHKMFSHEHGGFEMFITHSLPKFESLISLKVECDYGKFFTSSFAQNQDKWISVLNKIITGENGEFVQGIRMGEEEISGTAPRAPVWVWEVVNRDLGETAMRVGMKREVNLVIKHRVAHVKF